MAQDESIEDLFESARAESAEDSDDAEPDTADGPASPEADEDEQVEPEDSKSETDAPETAPTEEDADVGVEESAGSDLEATAEESAAGDTEGAPLAGGAPTLEIDDPGDHPQIPTSSRLTTGIDALDASLDGGIPPGRILTILAPPDTQSELLVKLLAAHHNCLYLSTLRPKWEVEEEVADFVQQIAADGRKVSQVQIEQLSPDGRLDDARRLIETVEEPSVIVFDSVNELEVTERPRYTRFLDDLKERLWETGSVAILYGIEDPEPPESRTVTLRRADMIWQLRRTVNADSIDHLLVMSKFRSGRALSEPLRLELTDEVLVDPSSDGASDVGGVIDGALDD